MAIRAITTWGHGPDSTSVSTWGYWPTEGGIPYTPPEPPPPADTLITATTPEQIFALVTASNLEVGFGAELLDANDNIVEDISDDLMGGDVEHQNYANVHGTCQLLLSRSLVWSTARVRPYQTLTGAGYTKTWPLGVYLLTTPQTVLGDTPTIYEVSGYDKLHLLQHPIGDTATVVAGTGYLDAVRAAITASGATPTTVLLDGTSEASVLPAPMVWVLDPESPTTYLDVINDLLAAVGYRGLYADANGVFCSEPYQSPLVKPPTWTLDLTDQHTVIVAEGSTLKTDIFSQTNWWRFIRKGMTAAPAEGTGLYTVDLSDGGAKIKSVQLVNAADQTALVAIGNAIVQTAQQVEQTLEVETGPLPLLGHFDVFIYKAPSEIGELRAQARSHQISLDGGNVKIVLEVL